mmetsp:Transcript_17522/g.51268  ORF Transcript_17522/g.51268 Transcript_17522/m.51268 type:complete len:251 (+) Transcript_17522:411-1163(+)
MTFGVKHQACPLGTSWICLRSVQTRSKASRTCTSVSARSDCRGKGLLLWPRSPKRRRRQPGQHQSNQRHHFCRYPRRGLLPRTALTVPRRVRHHLLWVSMAWTRMSRQAAPETAKKREQPRVLRSKGLPMPLRQVLLPPWRPLRTPWRCPRASQGHVLRVLEPRFPASPRRTWRGTCGPATAKPRQTPTTTAATTSSPCCEEPKLLPCGLRQTLCGSDQPPLRASPRITWLPLMRPRRGCWTLGFTSLPP